MTKRSQNSSAGSNDFRATLAKGLAAHQAGNLPAAEALYKRVLRADADNFDALHWLGVVEGQRGRHDAAIRMFGRALKINPHSARAHFHLGLALGALRRSDEALQSFDNALEIKPDFVEALFNRGTTLGDLHRHAEAVTSFEDGLAIEPDNPAALFNRGVALKHLERHAEALASFDRAVAIKPDFAVALLNLGNALADANRHAEAIASYDRALAIAPDFIEAMFARGELRQNLGCHEEATGDFAGIVEKDPDNRYAQGYLHYSRLNCCDWISFDENVARLRNDVRARKGLQPPFSFLAVSDSGSEQLLCSRAWLRDKIPVLPAAMSKNQPYCHDRIRLAYLSADFHDHATAFLMAELFERHDRNHFELTAVSFGPDTPSTLRTRLRESFDRFVDVREKSDREVACLLRRLETDIAVDLKGFTTNCRTNILAYRPAPIQINYLGYPGTMGADFIDYIIADRFVIPQDQRDFYSEKIVYLPDTYQPNDTKRQIGARVPTRAEVDLPDTGFVFCCFNNCYKITPAMFDVWMRLLKQIDGSVLWLLAGNAAALRNLRREAAARDVAPERLVFAPRVNLDDHLARHRLADLFLDTLPYNAHTTASDALWAGLPVLTCSGNTFASRVAGSLLRAVGLPELVTTSLSEYEAAATGLANNGTRLAALRARLNDNRTNYPLFDTQRFRRHIEAAYETMWRRHEAGEPPESFAVAAIGQ
jgi:protein O-GlcNAc transferase